MICEILDKIQECGNLPQRVKMQNSDRAIGNRLKAAREEAGLTQQQAAVLTNCDRSTLAKKENGDRAVYASELVQFASLYGRSVTYFIETG